jgi:RNA polymerase sigma-70 factor (ECF subfamily)
MTDLANELADDVDRGFERLVREHAGAVYTVARRWGGQPADAEDIAQTALAQAYAALRRYSTDRTRELRVRPWLMTITLNLLRNRARDASRRPGTEPLLVDSAGPPVVDELEEKDAVALLLDGLPQPQREAVVLRHVAGLSYAEVAEALGVPVGTVKARVSRGIAALREGIGER